MRNHSIFDSTCCEAGESTCAARRKLIRLLRNTSNRKWNDYALHPKLGKLTVGVMAIFNYSHSLEHLAQLIDIHEKAVLKQINA